MNVCDDCGESGPVLYSAGTYFRSDGHIAYRFVCAICVVDYEKAAAKGEKITVHSWEWVENDGG